MQDLELKLHLILKNKGKKFLVERFCKKKNIIIIIHTCSHYNVTQRKLSLFESKKKKTTRQKPFFYKTDLEIPYFKRSSSSLISFLPAGLIQTQNS